MRWKDGRSLSIRSVTMHAKVQGIKVKEKKKVELTAMVELYNTAWLTNWYDFDG